MDKFSSTILMLATFFLCINITEAAVTKWGGGTGTNPASGANATLTQTVAENLAAGATVLTVTATVDNTKGQFTIRTQPTTGQLEVDGTSGVVKLATGQSFDRETTAMVVIEITVTDTANGAGGGGGTVTTGTATVSITITDVNEFSPTFTSPSSATATKVIPDKSTASTAVYTVVATDKDAGITEKVITYSIATGNTNTHFAINGSSGAITVAKTLDKSTTPTYALVIHATDAGSDPALKTGTATVSVTVCDPCSGANPGATSFISLAVVIMLALFNLL